MLCTACNTDIPTDSAFCPKCGERLNDNGTGETRSKSALAQRIKEATDSGDDQERDVWQGGYSAKAMIGSWVLGGVLSVAALVAGIMFPVVLIPMIIAILLIWVILGLMLAYKKLGVHYALSTQRFIHRSGILSRTTDRLEVIDIDDVTFVQGLVQRMLGVGTIQISSSDRTHPELYLYGIDDVHTVAEQIDDVRRKERRRRGLHIEAI